MSETGLREATERVRALVTIILKSGPLTGQNKPLVNLAAVLAILEGTKP